MKLETERLILRTPRQSDWKDIVEGVGEYGVSKYLAVVPYPYEKKDALEWINRCVKKNKLKGNFSFVIELKSEKKIIGGIGITNYSKQHGTCETGSWINKNYWRKGYVMEAKIALNEYAFNKLKLRKMETGAYVPNKASNAAQLSMGYKYEGCKKKHHYSISSKKIYDENMYGLLKEDWKKNLPKLKKHLKEKIKKLKN